MSVVLAFHSRTKTQARQVKSNIHSVCSYPYLASSSFFPDADIFIVCFSVVQPTSFDNIRAKWIPQLNHFNPGKPCLLVGTKIDLRADIEIVERLQSKKHIPIDYDSGRALAISLKATEYKECSAEDGEGVRDVVEDAVRIGMGIFKQRRANAKKKTCELL